MSRTALSYFHYYVTNEPEMLGTRKRRIKISRRSDESRDRDRLLIGAVIVIGSFFDS
jgi:hypothetical protein